MLRPRVNSRVRSFSRSALKETAALVYDPLLGPAIRERIKDLALKAGLHTFPCAVDLALCLVFREWTDLVLDRQAGVFTIPSIAKTDHFRRMSANVRAAELRKLDIRVADVIRKIIYLTDLWALRFLGLNEARMAHRARRHGQEMGRHAHRQTVVRCPVQERTKPDRRQIAFMIAAMRAQVRGRNTQMLVGKR